MGFCRFKNKYRQNMDAHQALNYFAVMPSVNETVLPWAKSLADKLEVDLEKHFLDPDHIRFPIFGEHLATTVVDFNSGRYGDCYTQEHIDTYGKRLVKILNQSVSRYTSEDNFDEDGDLSSYSYDDSGESETQYIYSDGTIKTYRGASSWSSATEIDVDEGGAVVVGEEPTEESIQEVWIVGEDEEPESTNGANPKQDKGGKKQEAKPAQSPLMLERILPLKVQDEMRDSHRLTGRMFLEEKQGADDGVQRFKAPLFKLDALTANGNRYTTECAKNVLEDVKALYAKKNGAKAEQAQERSLLDIWVDENRIPDMLAQHDGRMGQGNALLERAGVIVDAEIGEIDGHATLFIVGETIPTTAGKDIAVQLERNLIVGVSLVGLPTQGKYESNDFGGHDVDRMHFLGADFTDQPANFIQFNDQGSANIELLN